MYCNKPPGTRQIALKSRKEPPMDAMNEVIIAPDFLALGLGGTNMMSMLWTVAMGRQAVGVEMRGDPFLGVHWNIREDFYHQLGLIDQILERSAPLWWMYSMARPRSRRRLRPSRNCCAATWN